MYYRHGKQIMDFLKSDLKFFFPFLSATVTSAVSLPQNLSPKCLICRYNKNPLKLLYTRDLEKWKSVSLPLGEGYISHFRKSPGKSVSKI